MVHAGGTHKSSSTGAQSLNELAEWEIKATRVAEFTTQAAREMKQQQTARVEQFHEKEAQRPLTEPREASDKAPANPPEVGVVEMDGGRIRTRDEGGKRGVTNPHWREFQAGCVVRLKSEPSQEDPRPEVPSLFLQRPKVQKLVAQLHRQRHGGQQADDNEESIADILAPEALVENEGDRENVAEGRNAADEQTTSDGQGVHDAEKASPPNDSQGERKSSKKNDPTRPKRMMRTCVATLEGADACGRILASEAADRGMDQAARKGFLGDGQSSIWKVWEKYFKRFFYTPILDFIHLMTYVYGVAMAAGRNADDGWSLHVKWITMLWSGQAKEVLSQWRSIGDALEIPENEALPENDPRYAIQRGITYLSNNLDRVDYPKYRKLGLPVTSTLMESLIKEFNWRVKGTEKFWNDPEGADGIVTLRAALLSEDDRFNDFFATRTGCRYRRRSTLEKVRREMDATPSENEPSLAT